MKQKMESGKSGLVFSMKKTTLTSSNMLTEHPVVGKVKLADIFYFLGFKNKDVQGVREVKRLILQRKAMKNLDKTVKDKAIQLSSGKATHFY